MSRRTLTTIVTVSSLLALWAVAFLVPLPYVTYSPGPTVDVLGTEKGREYISVNGHPVFRDDGQLRMTTVYVTYPDARVNLFQVIGAWLSRERAVYPRDAVYADGETRQDAEQESSIQMVSSQDVAIANAMTELGIDVKAAWEVLGVLEDKPADGKLRVRDVLVKVGGTRITSAEDVITAVRQAPEGQPLKFVVLRDGTERTVEVTPKVIEGRKQIGIAPGPGYTFPFRVDVNVDESIGGPSAGLMFSLAIYDTLTPGSLTDGKVVAGTGTLDAAGKVGEIGGIQQKIVAARDADAEIFLVPAANCAAALGAPRGDLRLVKAETMHGAVLAIKKWVNDQDAVLPTCEGA
ncbi:MAG: YlbL family protein [Nocardioides sp.]